MCSSYIYVFPILNNVERYLGLKKEKQEIYINRIRRETAEKKWKILYPYIQTFSKNVYNDIQSNHYKLRDLALFASDYYFDNNSFYKKYNYSSEFTEKIKKKAFQYSEKNYIFNIRKFKNIVENGGIEKKLYFSINENGTSLIFELIKAKHIDNSVACAFYETLKIATKKQKLNEDYIRFLKTIKINNHILKGD